MQTRFSVMTRPHYAEELATLTGIRRTKSRRGLPVVYLFLESRKRPKHVPWREFKRGCSASGLKIVQGFSIRQITNPAQAAKITALVSRR